MSLHFDGVVWSSLLSLQLFGLVLHAHCGVLFVVIVWSTFALSLQCRCISCYCLCLVQFCTDTAVSLHFVVMFWPRFALSLQCHCLLVLLFGRVLHCHCSVAASLCYSLIHFSTATAVSLHFAFLVRSSFALSLQCRCPLLLLLGPVLHCHWGVAAFCCCHCLVQFRTVIAV